MSRWILIPILFLLLSLPENGFGQDGERKFKVNGISIWSDLEKREVEDFAFVEKTNANWVSFQPYGIVWSDTSGVVFDVDSAWECSTIEGLAKNIRIAKSLGYYVFLKPHLIVKYEGKGVWVGNMLFDTEAKWQKYQESYFEYIYTLAHMADSLDVEMMSIGTELGTFPQERKAPFEQLIDSVRSIYKGALTFCANFDAYQLYPFWDKMDLIGIDAYFTIDKSKHPTLENCREGWKPFAEELEQFGAQYGKKILFAEFGYTSTDYCAFKPFGGHGNGNVNLVAQANAYRAVFDTFWDKPWFAGGFSWFWRFDNDQPENYDNTSYSPQNKPAANIIARNFLLFW